MSEPKKRFERAISVRNGPHQGTDFLMVEDQRSGKDRRLSTTPPPAPAGEREALHKIVALASSRLIGATDSERVDYYRSRLIEAGDIARDAIVFAHEQARASSPAPALGLTSEERALYERCATRYPACSTADVGDLLAIISRLTTPADGEGGR